MDVIISIGQDFQMSIEPRANQVVVIIIDHQIHAGSAMITSVLGFLPKIHRGFDDSSEKSWINGKTPYFQWGKAPNRH